MAASISHDGVLTLEEVFRFRNRQVRAGRHLYWDFLSLLADIKEGLARAIASGRRILSIGIDTWGVDFGLIDAAGNLLGNPVCYRDPSTEPYPARVIDRFGARAHYELTGTQVMPINTLFRLMALADEDPAMLKAARRLLFMPDLFSFFLCGSETTEPSIASTSEMLDASSGRWATEMLSDLGLPAAILPEIRPCGSISGYLTDEVLAEIGADYPIPVIAVGSHDTASAIHAMPPAPEGAVRVFLSSGTWSLLGVELPGPMLTEAVRLGGLTNERGARGRVTLLQNITGLWIVQRLMARWAEEGLDVSYPALIAAAREADIDTIIDVDDPAFTNPADMGRAIALWCSSRGLRAPQGQAETLRCVLNSLARRYARGIEQLNSLLPSPATELHIIGGGAKNTLLNELTARACGIPVATGPYEATAIGNIFSQAEALGLISSPADITSIIEP